MPIYDYVCQSCGTRIEVIHGVHAAGPETCEQCGGRLRRAVSVPAIHFKGSGWAKMDARSAQNKAPANGKPAADTPRTPDSTPAADKDPTAEKSPGADKGSGADKKTASDAKTQAAD